MLTEEVKKNKRKIKKKKGNQVTAVNCHKVFVQYG